MFFTKKRRSPVSSFTPRQLNPDEAVRYELIKWRLLQAKIAATSNESKAEAQKNDAIWAGRG